MSVDVVNKNACILFMISRAEAEKISWIKESLVTLPKQNVKTLIVLLKINLEKKDIENKNIVVKDDDISGLIID